MNISLTVALDLTNYPLKKADLLAQSPKFHNLLTSINKQEQKLIKR